MPNKPTETLPDAEQQQFCAEWLENHGVIERPTADQLMDMTEAYDAHRQRWLQARSGKGYRPLN